MLFLFLHLCFQEMHLLKVQRQALGRPVCTAVGGCRREKVRQVLQKDAHGSESAQQRGCTGSRDRRQISSKEGKRKKGNQKGRNGRHVSWYQPALQHPKAQHWLLLPQRALPSAPASHSNQRPLFWCSHPSSGTGPSNTRWFLLLCCWSDSPARFQPNLDCLVGTSVTGRRSHQSHEKCTEVADLMLASSKDLTTDLNTLGAKCQTRFICLVPLQWFFLIQTSWGAAHPFNQSSRTVSILSLALGHLYFISAYFRQLHACVRFRYSLP